MSTGQYLGGLALFAVTIGGCGAGSWWLTRPARGVVGVLAWATVWSALVALVHVAPLALGVLSRGSVVVATAVVVGGCAVLRRRGGLDAPGAERGRPGRLAVVLGVAIAGCALASLWGTGGRPFAGLDALNFQLPTVARWIQTGTLWRLDQYILDYSNTTYPHTGNVMLLAGVLPWRSTFAAGLVPVGFYGLAVLGAYAIARELRAPAPAAALAACVLAAVPVLARSGLQGALSDAPMLAWLAAGVLFLLRHARTGARRDLVLAGIGLGLAFGTKWYAVTAVPLILVAWAACRARRPGLLRDGAVLAGLVAAAGGLWLVRNWVETGNPLFPQPLLGIYPAPADPLREAAGFSLAHYAFDLEVWRTYLRPAFAVFLGGPGLLLAAGAAAAIVVALRGGAGRRLVFVAVATAGLAVVYVVTPFSALGLEGRPTGAGVSTRYALPALLGAAGLMGWGLGRLRGRWLLAAQVAVVVAVLDGLRRAFDAVPVGHVVLGCLVAATALALIRLARDRRVLATALAAGLAVTAVAGGEGLRRRAAGSGYGGGDPALAFVEQRAPAGSRIALAGTWTNEGVSPVLPAFGPRLRNEVRFAGPYVEGMLRRHPGAAPFLADLARGRFDLLIVGRGDSRGAPAREERWALGAGWQRVTSSPRLALLRAPSSRVRSPAATTLISR